MTEYRRLGNNHYMTGPDFFAKSEDGFTWSPIKEGEYASDLAAYEMAHQPKPKPPCITWWPTARDGWIKPAPASTSSVMAIGAITVPCILPAIP